MTTRAPKTFDCVQMKWGIQERIERELAGLTPDEKRFAEQRRIQEDPILGPFLRELAAVDRPLHAGDPAAERQAARETFLDRTQASEFRSTIS